MKAINFKGKKLLLVQSYYVYGGPALGLMEVGKTEIPYCVLSVNVPAPIKTKVGNFFIKNYSENEEIYKFLIEHGYLEETGHSIESGFVTIPECVLTDKAKEILLKEEEQ
ncbi:MAG: DUF4313 domain-containing protein [Bacteriovoracaceae bacterium]